MGEHLNRCTFLRRETNDVVAGVEDGRWWDLHLGSRFQLRVSFGGQFIESSGLEGDAIDDQTGFVPFGEVHGDLCLLHDLVPRTGAHLFDSGGDVLGVSACGGALKSHHDENQHDGDSGAHKEHLLVNWAFHGLILSDFEPRYTSGGHRR